MRAPATGRLGQEVGEDAGWRTFVLSPRQAAFVDAYAESLANVGFVSGHRDRSRARVFCGLVGDPEDWEAMPLEERLATRKDIRWVVSWCYLTQRISGGADYLVGARLHLGRRRSGAGLPRQVQRDGRDRGPQRLPGSRRSEELGGAPVERPCEGRRPEGRAPGPDHGRAA